MIIALFFVFLALVVFHFIYDAIIAPSLRFELRLSLFELRDRIRMLKILHGNQFDDKLYFHLQDAVNKQILLLHNINVVGLVQAYKLVANNRELANRLRDLERMVEDCEIEEIKQMHNYQLPKAFGKALAANSGGWMVYVVSLMVPLLLMLFLCVFAMVKIRRFTTKVMEIPDDRLRETFAYR